VLIREAWPVGIGATLKIEWQQGPLLILANSDLQAVGIYNAANKIPQQLVLIPLAVNASLFPILSRLWVQDKGQFLGILNRVVFWSFVLAIPMMIIAITSAPLVIEILFGPEFSDAAIPFALLMIVAGSLFPTIMVGEGLNAARSQRVVLAILGVLTPVLVVLLFVLSAQYGATGAALALMICYLAYTLMHFGAARIRMGSGAPLIVLIGAALAALAGTGAVVLMAPLGAILSAAAGACVAVGTLVLLQNVKRSRWHARRTG